MAELPALSRHHNSESFPPFGHFEFPTMVTPRRAENNSSISRLPAISNQSRLNLPPQQPPQPERENKWMKRREQTKPDFFQTLDVIKPNSREQTRTPNSSQSQRSNEKPETFFVPLTPKRSLEPKVREKKDYEPKFQREKSPLREVTNLREDFLANKRKSEFRNSKGGSVYFVPLSPGEPEQSARRSKHHQNEPLLKTEDLSYSKNLRSNQERVNFYQCSRQPLSSRHNRMNKSMN